MDRHYLYRRKDETIGYHYWLEECKGKISDTDNHVKSMGEIIKILDAPKEKRDQIYDILDDCEHQVDISLDDIDERINGVLLS